MSTLGLENGVVRIVPFDNLWADMYQEEADRIRSALGTLLLDIQHVGSTAIPGMAAKPILDIAVAVADYAAGTSGVPSMEMLGYAHKDEYGIPGRHFFIKGEPRTHHVHLLPLGSSEWRNHLVFRDALRRDAKLRDAYIRLKKSLTAQFSHDRDAYSTGKDSFIRKVIAQMSD